MRTTMVNKDELEQIVRQNRDNHRAVFLEAFDAYRDAAVDRLSAALAELRSGRTPSLQFGLVIPEDHTDDYNTVLMQLSMDTRDEIELEWDEFKNYVQDEWGWTRHFEATSASYGVVSGGRRR